MSIDPAPLKPLKFIIVGGGVAGLSAACALRGPGHEVLVLEKSDLLAHHEVGAAITIGPHARRIMAEWGFNNSRARGMAIDGFLIFDGLTGDVQSNNSTTGLEEQHGYPATAYHRVDLHSELKLLATSSNGGLSPPAIIRTGVRIVDLDTGSASVTLDSGEIIQGDVIIGADGSHSFVRAKVLGRPAEPQSGGISLFRVLLPRSVVESDPLLWKWFQDETHKMWSAPERYLLIYWCRDKQILNIAGMVPAKLTKTVPSGWNGVGDPSELKEMFGHCAEPVPQVLRHITKCGTWTVRDLDPLETWTKGRAILIGDAAHPMFPHLASGGVMAIEDAEAVGAAFDQMRTPPADSTIIPRILEQIQAVRWKRATMVQTRSRASSNIYFKIPARDGPTTDELGDDPTKIMVGLYSYKGAKEYARVNGIEYPGIDENQF